MESNKNIKEDLISRIDSTETHGELKELCEEISGALSKGYRELGRHMEPDVEAEFYYDAAEYLKSMSDELR